MPFINILQQFIELNEPNNLLYYEVATIIIILVIHKFLGTLIAKLILLLLKKANKKINEVAYFKLLVKPIQTFLVVFIILLSLEKLQLPNDFKNFSIYGAVTVGYLCNIVSVILFISITISLIISIINYAATILEHKANLTATQTDNQLIAFFKDFFKIIVVIMGILLVLKFAFGQGIGNLLTGLSIVGAAIALATKESLENLIASFIIFFDKPFVTGDTVKVQHVIGEVEKIGLRSTRIRTEEKTYITVPNKQMVDSIVDNQSLRTKRKMVFKLEINKETSLLTTQQLISDIKNILQQNNQIHNPNVELYELAKLATILQIDYFMEPINDEDVNALKTDINFKILALLEANNITMATVV